MKKRFVSFAILGAMCAISAVQVNAASFDCEKASSKIERTICTDERLSESDEKLNSVYKEVRKINPAIIEGQRDWVKRRNKASSIEELDQLHETRIQELESMLKPIIEQDDESVFTRSEQPKIKKVSVVENKNVVKDIKYYIDEVQRTGGMTNKDGFFSAKEVGKGYPSWLKGCGMVVGEAHGTKYFISDAKKYGQFDIYIQNELSFKTVAANIMIKNMVDSVKGDLGLVKIMCDSGELY
ncbi:hypothetical protein F485_gp061 [Aeromonas phage CC2]|uniref:Lysozyme inhibitor LprI-like N-terminal domain-containing protein n=1 Tax=Aeromonas phage CC2 TaxID=1204516 RepID=I6WM24_9CAUD|nr:hypothetical protein F485_gp061 [Aeromonas phage CC2]AFN39273.1 hypothetical protein CC2_301 [Aeromonas phage CC2]